MISSTDPRIDWTQWHDAQLSIADSQHSPYSPVVYKSIILPLHYVYTHTHTHIRVLTHVFITSNFQFVLNGCTSDVIVWTQRLLSVTQWVDLYRVSISTLYKYIVRPNSCRWIVDVLSSGVVVWSLALDKLVLSFVWASK